MAKKERVLTGGCLCGAVQYKVRDEFRYAMNCHCSQCRRVTGSAFKPFGGIERNKFALATGAKNLATSQWLAPEGLNVYDILRHETVVLTKAAVEQITTALKGAE